MMVETAEKAQAFVLQPHEGRPIENLGLRIMATGALTGGSLMAAVCTNPGPGGPPLHTHFSHDEFYFVMQGQYRFKIGDTVHEGGPGTFTWVPRGTTHTFVSAGPEEGKLLTFSLPGLDRFIERMSDLIARGVDQKEMTDLFREFDSEIDGPPLV